METVVENFVVDSVSMPIISEEPENTSQINPSSVGTLASTSSCTITSDTLPIITNTHKITSNLNTSESLPLITRQSNPSGTQDPTEMLNEKPDGSEGEFHDGMEQIFSSEDGQIITSDHHIFNEGEIIPDDSSSHIIMNADGSANILHANGEISESVKAHILSADGNVIAVDENLLHDTQSLQEHVTEVTEDSLEDEYPTPLLQSIKKEPLEDAESATIQIRVNASAPRKKDTAESPPNVEVNKTVNELISERSTKYTRVDRDDPRCRLHFVKYMKRDGKTIKIWECGICGKEFMHQYTLMRHLPTHTDERNFRCNLCGKAFRQMSTLSQHKATHSQSRPYVCDVCQKTFSRVSTLISHKKTHTEEKQHRCTFCNKAFHQKGNLKNHLFTHTNERPYKCDICGRGFNQSSNLQCHKTKSHADGVATSYPYTVDKYRCSYCDQSFSRRAQLRQHEEYKHVLYPMRQTTGSKTTGNNSNNNALLRKRKIGNVRIIQLPNGDRTFQEIGSDELSRPRKIRPRTGWKNGIMIEPIDTKAMHRALAVGRTPFALLKPCKGVPVVVKVQFALGSKHMLVPATADDLRHAGKFTVSSHQTGTKAVQIKVPVVATVIQRIDSDGQVHMDIEAPADDDDDEEENTNTGTVINTKMEIEAQNEELVDVKPPTSPIVAAVDNNLSVGQQLIINPVVQTSMREPVLGGEDEETEADLGSGIEEGGEGDMIISAMDDGGGTMEFPIDQTDTADESGEGINSVDLLATAVNLVSQAHMAKDGMSGMEGMHYLRQINLDEYEAVPPDHAQATHVMNQGQIQQIKMVDDGNAVTMDQENISALMDALQNAGYHLGTGNQQIIINADGNAMVVDHQVQMVIDGDMEGVISTEGVANEPVDPASVSLVVHEVPEGIQANDGESAT